MPKIEYIPRNFRGESLDIINQANVIIDDYQARGFSLTLRQLYYQFIAHDLFPEDRRWRWTGSKWVRDANGTKNAEPNYDWLGSKIAQGRDAGLIDWEVIVDRTRSRESLTTWNDPGEILLSAYRGFRIDKWDNQPIRPFVWIEKDALGDVVEQACHDEGIQTPYVSCRGYMSASTIWREAQMLARVRDRGQAPIIIHLGDHDPSGIDMSRDNMARLELYSGLEAGSEFELIRIALNMDQIEEYDPPPNPTKLLDSRASGYIEQYGLECWELDALDPDVLVSLIRNTIASYRDDDLWGELEAVENEYKERLRYVYQNWEIIFNGAVTP